MAIERCADRRVMSGTSGRHARHSSRKDTSGGASSSSSVNTTVTAITSSPSESAAEMPSAVSRDRPTTGTTTSDACFAGGGGTWPIPSWAPMRTYARRTRMNSSTSSGMIKHDQPRAFAGTC